MAQISNFYWIKWNLQTVALRIFVAKELELTARLRGIFFIPFSLNTLSMLIYYRVENGSTSHFEIPMVLFHYNLYLGNKWGVESTGKGGGRMGTNNFV